MPAAVSGAAWRQNVIGEAALAERQHLRLSGAATHATAVACASVARLPDRFEQLQGRHHFESLWDTKAIHNSELLLPVAPGMTRR